VRREDDTVTKWIRNHWGEFVAHPNYVLAMALARYINWPDTLAFIGFPDQWDPDEILKRLHHLQQMKRKIWTSAYIVSTNGNPVRKTEYVVCHVLDNIANARLEFNKGDTLVATSDRLLSFDGVGTFMAGQIIADLKNTPRHPLENAEDWWSWCAKGPGSMRGLNRICELSLHSNWNDGYFQAEVNRIRKAVEERTGMLLCAQDIQNCLCEFDKWKRVMAGQGRPRQTYPGVV